MMSWIARNFGGISPEPALLDHVPLNVERTAEAEAKTPPVGNGLTLAEKLALAAKRHGKPFKHAADGMPRIVTKQGVDVAVGVPLRTVAIRSIPRNKTTKE